MNVTTTAAPTPMADPPPEPRDAAVELCCGMGGIGIGLAGTRGFTTGCQDWLDPFLY